MQAPSATAAKPPCAPCWLSLWAAIFGVFNLVTWQAVLGVSVIVVATLWEAIPVGEKLRLSLAPEHLLWFLSWLKLYDNFPAMAAMWRVDEKTFRRRIKQVLRVLLVHLDFIRLDARLDGDDPFLNLAYMVIDGILCPVQVNRKVWRAQCPYYSPKHGTHGLKYEVAVHWRTGRLVWIAGGVPGSTHDLTMARQSGFLAFLRANAERALADKGYVGEELYLLCPFKGRPETLSPAERGWNSLMNPHRTIVENALARVTKFAILQQPFRGKIANHPAIFRVCAQIAQLDIFLHPLRADILEDPVRHPWFDDERDEPAPNNAGPVQFAFAVGA